jgi:hypothetical protein
MARTDNIGHPAPEGHPRAPLFLVTTPRKLPLFRALSLALVLHLRKIARTGFLEGQTCRKQR